MVHSETFYKRPKKKKQLYWCRNGVQNSSGTLFRRLPLLQALVKGQGYKVCAMMPSIFKYLST